jgi:hypothetical protein
VRSIVDMLIKDVTRVQIAARGKTVRRIAAAPTIAVCWLALAFVLAPSSVHAQSTTQAPAAPAATAPSVQGYGDHDKTCTSWTDGCVNCKTGPNDTIACSNTGLACQPQAIACLVRRQEPAAKPTTEPAKEPAK